MRFRRPSWPRLSAVVWKRVLVFLLIFTIALSVRFLTFNFSRAHLNDAGWFQYGSYAVFDKRAQETLDGRGRLFWIDDPSRTDVIQYPPAYPWMIAAIYAITGERSAYEVQRVQWVLDLILSMVLITGIAVTAYGWRAAMASSLMVALSPLLALVGVSPSADAPTTWFVLGGLWLLLFAARRQSRWAALGAGLAVGVACWLRVNPLYLTAFWAVALLLFARFAWKRKAAMSALVVLGTVLVISPIVIRNYLVFPDFTPTGGTIGANLWEGLGETELGRKNGFAVGDAELIEHERRKMGLPADFPLEAMWPDGIKREHERTRESLAFIRQHPLWYAGVMLHRMWGMLKVAGAPLRYYGTPGINVTPQKSLPPNWQSGKIALAVSALGMLQSVARYALLPLAAFGLWLAVRRDWLMTSLLLATVFYYLVPGTIAHTEIRYVLPMHGLLAIFAGLGLCRISDVLLKLLWFSWPKAKLVAD